MEAENSNKRLKIVGQFIRSGREKVGISQRELGLKLNPAVTTQFISNVERGITPLPVDHVAAVARALELSESDLYAVMEREYAFKITGGRSVSSNTVDPTSPVGQIVDAVATAFEKADSGRRREWAEITARILNAPNLIDLVKKYGS
ncbi:MAG: helix-turn-helix transcriptional regulator [Bdellovibrionales bacterium]|nr:helix-turn-helix transcriptional regulator [Bdellovibrionales bacterium]